MFWKVGLEVAHFLSDLSEVAASDGCAPTSAFARTVRKELSCALRLETARLYDQSLLVPAQDVGRGFMLGFS